MTEVITITIATTTPTPPNWGFSKMDEFVTLDSVSGSDIFPSFGHSVFKCSCTKTMHLFSQKF